MRNIKYLLTLSTLIKETLKKHNQDEITKGFSSICSKIRNAAFLSSERFVFPTPATVSLAEKLLSAKSIDSTKLLDTQDMFSIVDLASKIKAKFRKRPQRSKKPAEQAMPDYNSALLLLSDILLYKVYLELDNIACGRLYYQLNMCIVLDSMKFKPQRAEFVNLLAEVSEKVIVSSNESADVYWAVAMLNYKTQIYNTAIRFFCQYIMLRTGITPIISEGKDLQEGVGEQENRRKPEKAIVDSLCAQYLQKVNSISDKEKNIINAFIYIGYCFEKEDKQTDGDKAEDFNSAIDLFLNLLKKITQFSPTSNLATELHHGLGHFYNERAIFGSAKNKNKSADLGKAREQMELALKERPDYYSCYGSLFHEYGDYERANVIFSHSAGLETIQSDKELMHELMFYQGQTYSALDCEDDAATQYRKFEEYCSNTHNDDGIAHARIFKIRNDLRKIQLAENNPSERSNNQKKIASWQRDIKEYVLSEYASEDIRKEYVRTQVILKIFSSLYADKSLLWHHEDLFLYLREFISLMQYEALKLDYVDNIQDGKNDAKRTDNYYYRIRLGRLWIWCVGSKDIQTYLSPRQNKKLCQRLKELGIPITFKKPVNDIETARRAILKNKKPDMVIVIPPLCEDFSFEKELRTLNSDTAADSRFFFVNRNDSFYCSEDGRKKLPEMAYSGNVEFVLQLAFCMRSLEVLRKELLQPIPLFSLAPTHFSAAYDFQLGEDLNCMIELLESVSASNKEESKTMRLFLRSVDDKYRSTWSKREKVKFTTEKLEKEPLLCSNRSSFVACFINPEIGPLQNNDYASYRLSSTDGLFKRETLPSALSGPLCGIEYDNVYTTKVFPNYSKQFEELKHILERCDICDRTSESEVQCQGGCYYFNYYRDSDDPQQSKTVRKNCNELLQSILGNSFTLGDFFKCVLREEKKEGSSERFYILYIIVFNSLDALENNPILESTSFPESLVRGDYVVCSNGSKYEGEGASGAMLNRTDEGGEGILRNADNPQAEQLTKQYLRILHLSDLHYKSTADESSGETREAYIRKLKEAFIEISKKREIDYICFTGDIAHSGIQNDYEAARESINEIRNIFKVKTDHLLICPGNHDLDLHNFNERHPRKQGTVDKQLNLAKISELSRYFSAYSAFCKSISSAEYRIKDLSSYLLGAKQFDDMIVACVNTAWFSMDKNFKSQKPWIGRILVNAISNQVKHIKESSAPGKNIPVVTIMHHPVEEWEEDERLSIENQTNVWKKIAEMSDYILCGHTHVRRSLQTTAMNARILQGGCLYENNNNTYETSFYIHSIPLQEGVAAHSEQYLFIDDEWVPQGDIKTC